MSRRVLIGSIFFSAAMAAAGVLTGQSVFAASVDALDMRKLVQPGSYGDTIMEKTSADLTSVKSVRFAHWTHRTKYTCKACHTDLGFPLKANTVDIKQADLEAGKYCGKCHNGTAAFGLKECDRCHSRGSDAKAPRIEESLKDLPKDDFGNKVNWAKALKEKRISPSGLDGAAGPKPLDLDIVIPVTKFTPHPPDVMFPHAVHTEQLDCSSCHPAIFKDKKGGNTEMNMLKIISGQYCGTCHGRVAFPQEDCFRCHSQPAPKAEEPKKDEKKQ